MVVMSTPTEYTGQRSGGRNSHTSRSFFSHPDYFPYPAVMDYIVYSPTPTIYMLKL